MPAWASMRIASANSALASAAPPGPPGAPGPPAMPSPPREYRHVDRSRRALSADGLDRVVHLRQPERVRHHQLEREAMRRELVQGELDGAVRMATRALERDAFAGQPPDRKIGKLLVALALHDHRARASLQRLDAEQRRRRTGAD